MVRVPGISMLNHIRGMAMSQSAIIFPHSHCCNFPLTNCRLNRRHAEISFPDAEILNFSVLPEIGKDKPFGRT
jgi:hypothetical protein